MNSAMVRKQYHKTNNNPILTRNKKVSYTPPPIEYVSNSTHWNLFIEKLNKLYTNIGFYI